MASLTIGSIGPIATSGSLNEAGGSAIAADGNFYGSYGSIIAAGGSISGIGEQGFHEDGMMPHMMGIMTDNYTTVIIDMSKGQVTQDDMAEFIVHRHDMVKTNNFELIRGNMIIQRPGMQDRAYPVHWVRTAPQALENGLMMASFVADMNVPMDLMTDPAPGFPPEGSHFMFHSMINFTSPILSAPTPLTVTSGDYNNQINESQTVWHTQEITSKSTSLSVDLKWQNASDSLRLMIYTPDGHTLGPYYDVSDGKMDGDINLNITNTDGIATGTWSFKVTGTNVSSTEGYYIRAW